jgi:DNA polymerase
MNVDQERLSLDVGDESRAPVPDSTSLRELREAAKGCRACDLWRNATQTVFGAGPAKAEVMFVGEQPGDQEDLAGEPFVGPAGRVFDEALAEAGIDRGRAYVTNAVKHFKFQPRGKRRIHQKPNAAELAACRPWLDAELRAVRPRVLVLLGSTAAQALLGRQFRVTRDRGRPVDSPLAPVVLATVHPSSILRAPDEEARRQAMRDFVDDLRVVARAIASA